METKVICEKDMKIMASKYLVDKLNISKSSRYYNQKLEIIDLFLNNEMREDYFAEKGTRFYKLGAHIYLEKGISEYEKSHIIKKISELPIKPRRIWVYEDRLALDFYTIVQFHFKSWMSYLRLLIDFIDYIEKIDTVNLSYIDCFDDDSEIIDEKAPYLSNVRFDKSLFDADEIEIYTYVGGRSYSIIHISEENIIMG